LDKVQRIKTLEARQKVTIGEALLVCAYESEIQFKNYQLEGAISFSAYKSLLASLTPEQEIIFYCN
jgi:hypothetical protein